MIAAQGLTKFYGDTCAIEDLDFQIADGEVVGILGLNGAGKSTTLHILASLLVPSAGTVSINGVDVLDDSHATRKMVGFLPELPPLYTEMTVEGYLTFLGQIRGLSRRQTQTRLEEVAEATRIQDVVREVIGTLSHGFRQRVGIAQSLIHDPAVLILDEPISGLDPAQIKDMREMLRGLGGKHTVLISSHILSEISQTCDRILVIHEGRMVASGTEEELATAGTGQRLHVVVRGDRDQVISHIRRLDGVVACESMAVADSGAGRRGRVDEAAHHLHVDAQTDLREALARTIIEGGFGLLQLSPRETELEWAFLQLTQKGRAGLAAPIGGDAPAQEAKPARNFSEEAQPSDEVPS